MSRVRVEASVCYDIIIEKGAIKNAGGYICEALRDNLPQSAVVVTDTNVAPLYLDRVIAELEASGIKTSYFTILAGERSKNAGELIKLLEFMAERRLTRSDMVVALGGGVVGDLAGFAAAVFLRGVRLVQIPTTLLAAVDSSVGGKTAIDLCAGKNLAGAFYQPELVICDYETLATLNGDAFRDGCAEVIKYAVLRGGELADILFKCVETADGRTPRGIFMDNPELLEKVITACVDIKRDIVACDEFDRGRRQLLNLGHTIGHAVEAASNYSVSHGSAVSIGLRLIAKACLEKNICSYECYSGIYRLLTGFGLPVEQAFTEQELYGIMLSDKKRGGDRITLVLPHEFGECELRRVSLEELKEFLNNCIRSKSVLCAKEVQKWS